MKWGAPEHLVYGWILVALAALLFAWQRKRQRQLDLLIEPGLQPDVLPERHAGRPRLRLILWLSAVALIWLAWSRPQWGFRWEEVKRRGLDILIVLDTSRSMLAQDVKPNRLQQAKWGVRDFVRELKGDRVGLVAFAGSSFLQCPLTMDYAAFLMTLDDVYAGLIPKGGTDLEQAIGTAVESFDTDRESDRAIILITDGDQVEGDALAVSKKLREENIRLFAIGIGSREGELIPVPGESGATVFLKDREGKVVKSALQEDLLERLALASGGSYIRSSPGESGFERIFREGLASLKRGEHESKTMKIHEERFQWLAACALLLLVCEALFPQKRAREKAAMS